MRWKAKTPSLSIHELVIERHLGRDPVTQQPMPDQVVATMLDAVRAGRLAAEKASRVAEAIMNNEMQTVPARHRQTRNEGWQAVAPALRGLDAAREVCTRTLADIEKRTHAPPTPTDAVTTLLASEVRTRLAAMKPTERRAAFDAALRDADDVVMGAVLNAPAMLSGMTSQAEADALRGRWRQLRHGPEIARAERLEKARADLDRAGELILAHFNSLSRDDIVQQAEASEKAVAEAIAS